MSFAVNHIEKSRGEALIFLHGIGGDAHSWDFQIDSFSDAYRTIAWDMPGYGASEIISPMTFEGLAGALFRLMDHLEIDQAHIVGHSMGGMVAQQAAADHPDRIAGLILSATSPAFGRPDGDFQQKFVASRLAPLEAGKSMADLAAEMTPGMLTENANPKGLEMAMRSMSNVPVGTYKAAMHCLVTFDRRDNLANLAMPTLLIAGELDQNAPAPMMEKMASKIPGADYVCLAGAGHLANMQMPEAFDDTLRQFLDKIRKD